MKKQIIFSLVFFLSGFSAIIYELLWIRLLALSFGGVTLITAVIASLFLSGLALGAFWGGKFIDRFSAKNFFRKIFAFYAGIEFLIGILGILNWQLFSFFSATPGIWRYYTAPAMVFLQALVIGITWPTMFKLLVKINHQSSWGGLAGKLTFLNTIGGAAASFFSGYLLLVNFGVKGTFWLAFLGNFLVALLMLFFARRVRSDKTVSTTSIISEKSEPRLKNTSSNQFWLILFLLGLTGFIGMAFEIFWLRCFALIVGGTIYSFTLILTVILFGLALGGLIFNRLVKQGNFMTLLQFIWFEALFIFIGIIFLSKLPYFLVAWYQRTGRTLLQSHLIRITFLSLVVLVPSIFSGMVLPLGISLFKDSFERTGTKSGLAYFVNTFGSVLGGFLGAVFLLPSLGLQVGMVLLTAIFGFTACLLYFLNKFFIKGFLSLIILLIFGCWAVLSWDKEDLASGAYLYGSSVLGKASGFQLLSYEDGQEATITIVLYQGIKTLRNNGKADASDKDDMGTQAILGHLPVLLHPNPKKVLVIGLGGGVTAGAVSQHQEVETITVVEIEPKVAEAAKKYFPEVNNNVLGNPKTKLVIGDARNYLLETDNKFEVITSQPSNPWIVGEANLFTKEFFEIGKKKLTENGIFFQWLDLYNLRSSEVKSIIATFSSVFPYFEIWTSTDPVDIFLAGKLTPFRPSWDRFSKALTEARVRESLLEIGLTEETGLFSLLWVQGQAADKLFQGGEINTDSKPLLEYRAPYGLYQNTLPENFHLLSANFQKEEALQIEGLSIKSQEKIQKARQARKLFVQALEKKELGDRKQAIALTEEGLKQDNQSLQLKHLLAQLYFDQANTTGDIASYEKALKLDEKHYQALINLISSYLEKNSKDKALELIKIGQQQFPWSGEILMYEGILAGMEEDWSRSEELLKKAKSKEPGNILIYNNLAHLYYRQVRRDLAIKEWEASLKLKPDQTQIKQMLSVAKRMYTLHN